MPSTYSSNLKLELMATGENSGTWGNITNTNLGTAAEQAIVGYGAVSYASDANLTISITNSNAAQAARALVLNVTSAVSLTGTRELVVPTIEKQYIVQNNTTGSQSITVKTSAGTGITVPNGRKAHLYVNGTDVIQMFDFVDINGGAIDGTTIGAASASTGAFTTLNASGATTLDGNVALGNASGDLITFPGTINSHLLFTDNTYDIGASGATRPRNLFLAGNATVGGNLSVGGTLTLTGGVNLNGNVTVGDNASDTLTINATITSNLLFTDNTYDIGASGATRPRNLFLAGNITAGGNQTLTGSLTVDSTTDSSSTTTGSIQTDGGVGIAKKLFVGLDANIYGITVGRGAGAGATNTAVGNSALAANTTGIVNAAFGQQALLSNTTGGYNVAVGRNTLYTNTTGGNNIAIGFDTLYYNNGGNNVAIGGQALGNTTTASNNTAVGYQAGYSNTTGANNVAIGYQAAYANTTGTPLTAIGTVALYSNTTGVDNVAVGANALYLNTTGSYNTALGRYALQTNTTANSSTAVGYNALTYNTADYNTAVGVDALRANTTSPYNTAVGYQTGNSNTTGSLTALGAIALYGNTTGVANTAVGGYVVGVSYAAMQTNTTGSYNVALGSGALYANTTASNNTALGYQAAYSNTTGSRNIAIGPLALYYNTTGVSNTAIGSGQTGAATGALGDNTTGSYNTAVGDGALKSNTTASNNTAVGYQAAFFGTAGANNTAVGYQALVSNNTGGENTAIGSGALYSMAVATGYQAFCNTAVGRNAGYSLTTGNGNTLVGRTAGFSLTTGKKNTLIGASDGDTNYSAGYFITTGNSNVVLGSFSGNQGGLDIRTANNYIVLSDGDGNPRWFYDNAGFWKTGGVGNTWTAYSGIQVANSGSIAVYSPTQDVRITSNAYANSGWKYQANGSSSQILLDGSSTNGVIAFYSAATGTAGNATTNGVNAAGDTVLSVSRTNSVALEGALSYAGTGITFPATQNASSNANTLDDYEEGTWTPALRGSGTAGTFNLSVAVGNYTKVGNMVTLYCAITVTSVSGSPTGDLQITGLPFACAAGTSANGASQTQYIGLTQTATVSFSTRGSASVLYLCAVNGSQVAVVAQANAVAGSAIVDFCISYPT